MVGCKGLGLSYVRGGGVYILRSQFCQFAYSLLYFDAKVGFVFFFLFTTL